MHRNIMCAQAHNAYMSIPIIVGLQFLQKSNHLFIPDTNNVIALLIIYNNEAAFSHVGLRCSIHCSTSWINNDRTLHLFSIAISKHASCQYMQTMIFMKVHRLTWIVSWKHIMCSFVHSSVSYTCANCVQNIHDNDDIMSCVNV